MVRREGFEPPAFWSVGCLKVKSESFRLRFVLFATIRSADFSVVSAQPCLLFSCSGSKVGQTRCARTHSNSVSPSIAPEATARPTSTTSSFVQSSRIPLTSRVELIYIERGSPGRKLFGLFSYSPKLRLSCSQVLWYNLNAKLRNKSRFLEGR